MLFLSASVGPFALVTVLSTLLGKSDLVACTAASTTDDGVENENGENLSDLIVNAGTAMFGSFWATTLSESAVDLGTVIAAVTMLLEGEVDGIAGKVKPTLLLVATGPSTRESGLFFPNNESEGFGSGAAGFSTGLASL